MHNKEDGMKTAREEVLDILKNIPKHSSLEDIQYHIYVRQKIRKGLEASEKGQVISHEQAMKRAKKWLKK